MTVSVPRHFVHLSPVGFELLVEKFLRFIYKARLERRRGVRIFAVYLDYLGRGRRHVVV